MQKLRSSINNDRSNNLYEADSKLTVDSVNYSLMPSRFETTCHNIVRMCDFIPLSCVSLSSMLMAFAALTDRLNFSSLSFNKRTNSVYPILDIPIYFTMMIAINIF